MLSVALLVACGESAAESGLPAVGRPASASQGPRVAMIVALRGDVSVAPGHGPKLPATAELQLLRDDRLVVGHESFVVVVLHNGHFIRINQDSTLRVDGLALFDDPPVGADVQRRFTDLLTPDEREDEALRGAFTRVAGWNTRMTAAETLPAQSASLKLLPPAAEPAKIEANPEAPTTEAAGGPTKPLDAPSTDLPGIGYGSAKKPEKADKATRPRGDEHPAEPNQTGRPTDDLGGISTEESGPPPPPSKQSQSLDLPDTVQYQRGLDGPILRVSLPRPLRVERKQLARCAGAGAVIRGRIEALKLVELRVEGVASACVPGLIGERVALEDGWIEMTVQP